jgi:hypothetical protein
MPDSKINDLQYLILRVETVSVTLNIPEDYVYLKEQHKVQGRTNIRFEINSEKNFLDTIIEIDMKCLDKERNEEIHHFLNLKTLTRYRIDDLDKYLIDDDLDDDVFKYLVEQSISHTRGMQSVYTKGTPIGRFLLPKVDVFNDLEEES